MTKTTISNSFTGYHAEIKTCGFPSISTIRRHLRKSKAGDCKSVTTVEIDGVEYELNKTGELVRR